MPRKARKNFVATAFADKQSAREASLLAYPAEGRDVELDDVVDAMRLLLIARTRLDREIIGYCLCQKLPRAEVGERLNLTTARVNELLASLRKREKELYCISRQRDTLELMNQLGKLSSGRTYRPHRLPDVNNKTHTAADVAEEG